MANPNANDYDALTFDCYGTLIDWATGLVNHLHPVLLERDAHVIDDFLLEFFAEAEPAIQADGVLYSDVLREVLRRLGSRLGFTPSDEMLDAFAASVVHWPVFEDTVPALERLSEHFDLVIVSNVDSTSSRPRMSVPTSRTAACSTTPGKSSATHASCMSHRASTTTSNRRPPWGCRRRGSDATATPPGPASME